MGLCLKARQLVTIGEMLEGGALSLINTHAHTQSTEKWTLSKCLITTAPEASPGKDVRHHVTRTCVPVSVFIVELNSQTQK